MSPDEPPKKPPRASWEPPDPDEKPAEAPPRAPKKSRKETPPPRASWETPAEGTPVVTAPEKPQAPPPTTTPPPTPMTTPAPTWDTPAQGWDAPAPAQRWDASTASGSWTEPVSATSPLAADLPAPPSASVVFEPAMTSASMISPAPPASAMVDDPRLPTVPPAPPVDTAPPKRERKKPPPPPTFDDDDLDDGDRPERKRGTKVALVAAVAGFLGLGIAALVFLGNSNKERLLITCEPQQVIAKQGRGFPPWGERNIDDEGMWKPIKIPPEAECKPRETDDENELSRWYLELLVDRASVALTANEGATHGSKEIDEAYAMLEQALLHTRGPDRREQRRDIERLLGDVGYWRANGKLKDAANALAEAAKQFDAAAAQRPRHVSDASAWATHVRKLVEDLKAGPGGAATTFPPTPPNSDRQPAPPGVALPVEPPKAGSAADPTPPIDAGLPTGGVLL